jgi:L-ascorbate metabolism protein UlaG (beta-lactamase superfamily)
MWSFRGVNVHWLGHDSFVLQGSKTVVIDPFNARGDYKADFLLISHEHHDHLSEDDIRRFSGPSTVIVAPRVCEQPLQAFPQQKRFVSPNSKTELTGLTVETIPAYNLNKFREPGKVFHPKADGRVGYIVTLDGVRFYHAGDSDATPEMRSIAVDVAFLPVSGTYVMTPDEAAEAAAAMKVEVVIPMHYGAGVAGTVKDAERFRDLLRGKRQAVILDKEG